MRLYWQIPIISEAIFSIWKLDAARKLEWIVPWINKGDRLLEIGSGPGSVLAALRDAGYDAKALDIHDSSFDESLKPVVYDGINMPFDAGSFDTALLLTTLHHTHDPEQIIAEAMRVARRVIIIEDVFDTPFQRRMTKVADSFTNMEFIGHPHSNKDDQGWFDVFDALGLDRTHVSHKPMVKLFKQALYVLEPRESALLAAE
jgi:SAM-dependent methyltransferase